MKLTKILNKVLLTEGRIEDAERYLHNAVGLLSDESEEIFGHFVHGDPSGNQKYLMWMVKMYDTDSGFSPNILLDIVQRYHNNLDKINNTLILDMGLYSGSKIASSPKNIDSYPTYRSLKGVVEAAEESVTRKQREKEAKAGVDKLYEDDRWLLVKPNTYEGSCYYGSATKWCTASKDAPSHFESYSKTGNLFYIIDKTKDVGDFFKIALHKKWNGEEDWYDRADNELTQETENAIRSLLPIKLINALEEGGKAPKPKAQQFTYTEFRDNLKDYIMNQKGNIQLKTNSGVWNLEFFRGQWEWTGLDPRIAVIATPFSTSTDPVGDFGVVDGLEIYAEYEGDKEIDIDTHIPYHQLTVPFLTPEIYLDKDPPENYQNGISNVEGNLKRFLMHIYLPKVKEVLNNPELVEFVGADYRTWEPNSYVSSFQFNYPPRKGTMTQKFVDYLGENPRSTSNQFYEDVLGYSRPRAHNNMFFSSIKDSGIVKMERKGRQFVYSIGPNYSAWTQGKLLRTNKKYGQL